MARGDTLAGFVAYVRTHRAPLRAWLHGTGHILRDPFAVTVTIDHPTRHDYATTDARDLVALSDVLRDLGRDADAERVLRHVPGLRACNGVSR